MSKENNKMQVDIDTLLKQNVNDLSAIKELYRKLKEVEGKITQIKYIDSNLLAKLQKEYEKLKRIILDENIQAKLTDDIETIKSQLDTNTQQAIIKKINPKLLPPPHIRAVGDGITNDTEAFNVALRLLNVRNDSNINFNNRPGILELDEGVYVVDSILLRSNLTISGQGIGITILIPNGGDNYDYFLFTNYTGTNKLTNFELKDLSILKTVEHQFKLEDEENRLERSILDLSYCTSVRIQNVVISGFKGVAVNFRGSFDTNIDNLQVLGCGDFTHPSIYIHNEPSDGSNALHFKGIRVEQCSKIYIYADNNTFNREIQFACSKFEGTPIVIDGSSNINFVGNQFTWFNGDVPLFTIKRTNTTETYGININGCSLLSNGNGYLINSICDLSTKFVGCSIKGFAKICNGKNLKFIGCEMYDNKAPLFDAISNLVLIGNEIYGSRGIEGEYIIRIGSNSILNSNEILSNQNTNLNGIYISSDGNCLTDNFVMTTKTAINVQGNNNKCVGNKGIIVEKEGAIGNRLEHYSSLYVPTTSQDTPQNIRFNPTTNKLELFRKSSNSWGETYVRANNVAYIATGSDLETTIVKINEILTALKNANFMIP